MSLMGIPASARATDAAVRPAHLVPALAWRISMYTSMDARGYSSSCTTLLRASEMSLEISTDLLSVPGLFLSVTE